MNLGICTFEMEDNALVGDDISEILDSSILSERWADLIKYESEHAQLCAMSSLISKTTMLKISS